MVLYILFNQFRQPCSFLLQNRWQNYLLFPILSFFFFCCCFPIRVDFYENLRTYCCCFLISILNAFKNIVNHRYHRNWVVEENYASLFLNLIIRQRNYFLNSKILFQDIIRFLFYTCYFLFFLILAIYFTRLLWLILSFLIQGNFLFSSRYIFF